MWLCRCMLAVISASAVSFELMPVHASSLPRYAAGLCVQRQIQPVRPSAMLPTSLLLAHLFLKLLVSRALA